MSQRTQPTLSILLVEDSDEDYAASVRALRDAAVAVALPRCTRGEEALEYLYRQGRFAALSHVPRPALILLDLNLPGMDGRELLATIKADEQLKSIPIVIMTTSHNPHDIDWCYKNGANSYQVKALGYEQFRNELRLLVEYWLRICCLPSNAGEDR